MPLDTFQVIWDTIFPSNGISTQYITATKLQHVNLNNSVTCQVMY